NLFFPNKEGHNPQGFPNYPSGTDTATWISTYFFLDSGRPMWPGSLPPTSPATPATAPETGSRRHWCDPAERHLRDVEGAVRAVDKTHTPYAITATPDPDPAKNDWNLGAGSDTPPGGFAKYKD